MANTRLATHMRDLPRAPLVDCTLTVLLGELPPKLPPCTLLLCVVTTISPRELAVGSAIVRLCIAVLAVVGSTGAAADVLRSLKVLTLFWDAGVRVARSGTFSALVVSGNTLCALEAADAAVCVASVFGSAIVVLPAPVRSDAMAPAGSWVLCKTAAVVLSGAAVADTALDVYCAGAAAAVVVVSWAGSVVLVPLDGAAGPSAAA